MFHSFVPNSYVPTRRARMAHGENPDCGPYGRDNWSRV